MSKYDVAWTGQFKKDYKLARKRNLKIELLDEIIRKLSRGEVLSQENRDHDSNFPVQNRRKALCDKG